MVPATAAVLAELSGQPVTVRWILMRVLAHSARHVGQMQIVRRLWELNSRKE
jgi:Protein of unknown function (DUF664)